MEAWTPPLWQRHSASRRSAYTVTADWQGHISRRDACPVPLVTIGHKTKRLAAFQPPAPCRLPVEAGGLLRRGIRQPDVLVPQNPLIAAGGDGTQAVHHRARARRDQAAD